MRFGHKRQAETGERQATPCGSNSERGAMVNEESVDLSLLNQFDKLLGQLGIELLSEVALNLF